MSRLSRREMMLASAGFVAGATLLNSVGRSRAFAHEGEQEAYPPTRVITRGPRHHWFGYYDKLQFDPSCRYVLGMSVPFEHRSPKPDDVITIGMVDLQDGDRWVDLNDSRAWNWQQGCMLQWVPGSDSMVLWNDRVDDQFVCHLQDVKSGHGHTIPRPIYSVSPDGRSAVTLDFARVADVRPGYGYAGIKDPNSDKNAPDDSGIFHIDLNSGQSSLIISLKQIAELGEIPENSSDVKHYFNHLLYSPDGSRFILLHRWRYPNGRRLTRLLTAKPDGTDVRIVIENGYASHFIWRDPAHIFAQSKNWLGNSNWGDFLFEDKDGGGDVKEIGHGVLDPSGHISYLPGNEWILNDTYPKGTERLQTPHLFHNATGKRVDLGKFQLPEAYTGEWRVDTHPRFSPDSHYVCIDAPHEESGRQLHLIDISELIG